MLIRTAEIQGIGVADVRVRGSVIVDIGDLAPQDGEPVLEGRGAALLPGLHDHHIHCAALAAQRQSVTCGPPAIADREELAHALRFAPGKGWVRGTGYHESVLGGLPEARELDALLRDRPLRMQHRSGRMWLLNSAALDELLTRAEPPPGLERDGTRFTGRLFDEDAWLQEALRSTPPGLGAISADLARHGVTGLTDMSPPNDGAMAGHFARERASGALAQACVLAGSLALGDAVPDGWQLGPAKLHLHENALPDFDDAAAFVTAAHAMGRVVAVHCVSEVELVYTLALFEHTGTLGGDRIEHVSVASPDLLDRMADLALHACVQPHFIRERGDRYRVDVAPRDRPHLYRLRSLIDRGIPLAGGSDAPYGGSDPWAAMRAAVARTTASGATIGPEEALDPDEALALYLADPCDLTRRRTVAVGAPADLCLLDRPWRDARLRLCSDDVVATIAAGRIVHQRIDQPPS